MNYGLHEYTLQQRIEEVKLCITNKMWQSALALSLTIPDICGQIKYKGMKRTHNNGKVEDAYISEKYSEWFHKYVEHYFADEQGWKIDGFAVNPYFTGDLCYKLRCAFLHSGDDTGNKLKFHKIINSCDAIRYNNNGLIDGVDIDIVNLCTSICEGAMLFFNEWRNAQDFKDRKCRWIDPKEWNDNIEALNKVR